MWSVDRKRLTGAIILIVFLLIPAIFVSGAQGYIPVLFFLFLYLLSFTVLLIERRRVIFDDMAHESVCVRGDAVEHVIRVENGTFFIIPAVQLSLYDASGTIGTGLLKETISLGPKEVKELPAPIIPDHIGTFRCGVSDMVIRGMLGIVSWKETVDRPSLLTVLPRLHDIENFIEFAATGDQMGCETNGLKSNSDPAGAREYMEGDAMKDIHWKLSASGRGLMTKLRVEASTGDMDIVLNLGDSASAFGRTKDILVETAMSLMNYSKSHGMRARLIYMDEYGKICGSEDVPLDLFSSMESKSSGTPYQEELLSFAIESGTDRTNGIAGADISSGAPLIMITGNPSKGLIADLSKVANVRHIVLISLEGNEDEADRYEIDHFVISKAEDLDLKVKRVFDE